MTQVQMTQVQMTQVPMIQVPMIQTLTLDQGWTTTAQAEHGSLEMLSALGLRAVLAWTSFVPADADRPPRVVVTAQATASNPELDSGLDVVAPQAGRAFVFAGMTALERIVTVRTLLDLTAVQEVVTLGGAVALPSDRIDTQRHLRPEFSAGRLVLRTRPAANVELVPFEQPNPTPCCAAHL